MIHGNALGNWLSRILLALSYAVLSGARPAPLLVHDHMSMMVTIASIDVT